MVDPKLPIIIMPIPGKLSVMHVTKGQFVSLYAIKFVLGKKIASM